jgi:hypothetical protein
MISLVLVWAAGCDTMDQDVDGQALSINDDPAYFLANNGYIDLGSRIVSPGKIKVEITGSTRNGELTDLGKGLLQYQRFKGNSSAKDSFRFRVFSNDNKVIGEDTINIIIPTDTTQLPCAAVYTRNDSVRNVTGAVTVDVAANDYSCSAPLTITVNVAPRYGTASIVGNKIQYVPGPSFPGHDNLLYKAATADPAMIAGYAMLWLIGPDTVATPGCTLAATDDLFFKPKNDTSLMYLDVLANDIVCDSLSGFSIASQPQFGTAFVHGILKKIGYRNVSSPGKDDTLRYRICGPGGCATAKTIIKRQ